MKTPKKIFGNCCYSTFQTLIFCSIRIVWLNERGLARDNALPVEVLMEISKTYVSIAEKITGASLQLAENPKAEIIEVLRNEFALVD